MKILAGLLILVLPHHGHWFGGAEGTVRIGWGIRAKIPDAVVAWELRYGPTVVQHGRVGLRGDGEPSRLKITMPQVRVRTPMELSLRVLSVKGNKELAKASATVHLYPKLPAGVGKAVSGKQVVLWDRAKGLSEVLKAVGISHKRIHGPSGLSMTSPDLIIVGQNQLDDKPFTQSALIEQARRGANVLVLAQERPHRLAGLALVKRKAPVRLTWRAGHPLARHLKLFQADEMPPTVRALVLPHGTPAEVVGHWPVTDRRPKRGPLHVLLAVMAVGKGRLVLCQMPMGNWKTDPRSQLFLADVLDYMSSPVRPTPATARPAGSVKEHKDTVRGKRRAAPLVRFKSRRRDFWRGFLWGAVCLLIVWGMV